jgi:hypothetical protein
VSGAEPEPSAEAEPAPLALAALFVPMLSDFELLG